MKLELILKTHTKEKSALKIYFQLHAIILLSVKYLYSSLSGQLYIPEKKFSKTELLSKKLEE